MKDYIYYLKGKVLEREYEYGYKYEGRCIKSIAIFKNVRQ